MKNLVYLAISTFLISNPLAAAAPPKDHAIGGRFSADVTVPSLEAGDIAGTWNLLAETDRKQIILSLRLQSAKKETEVEGVKVKYFPIAEAETKKLNAHLEEAKKSEQVPIGMYVEKDAETGDYNLGYLFKPTKNDPIMVKRYKVLNQKGAAIETEIGHVAPGNRPTTGIWLKVAN